MKYHCPDCVEPLKKDRKKLGAIVVWIRCPICGYRTRPTSDDRAEELAAERLSKRIKIDNVSGGVRDNDVPPENQ